MLRSFFILAVTAIISLSVQAQSAYTLHTITAGESLSALAKSYHTTVGDIMRLNGMHSDSKLIVGEKIKMPATSAPVTATPVKKEIKPAATKKEALTHTVLNGESLYRISQKYKIPVKKLMTLNGIDAAGDIKVGQVLLVSDGTPPVPVKSKTAPAVAGDTVQQILTEKKPVEQQQAAVDSTPPVSNTVLPTPPPAPVENPVSTVADNSINNAPQVPVRSVSTMSMAEGFFTSQFRQNVEGRNEQTKTGVSMTFKSASGWADKKFYVLMNDAPPGSIVKLANGNKVVYAKVLWNLGSQKENEGLDFRISTAAAATLNITDEKFNLTVTYFQ